MPLNNEQLCSLFTKAQNGIKVIASSYLLTKIFTNVLLVIYLVTLVLNQRNQSYT